jgi:hypothetical protein
VNVEVRIWVELNLISTDQPQPTCLRRLREQNQRSATLMGVVRQAVKTSAGRSGFWSIWQGKEDQKQGRE